MDLSEISRSFQQLWEAKPTTVVLLVVGFIGFLVLVVDTWRHKRRRKRPR
jgi:hypothetical protein